MRSMMVLAAALLAFGACDGGCNMGDPIGTGGTTDPPTSTPTHAQRCESTGGVWSDDGCECAQDGASLHYEFIAGLGCRFPDDSDLVEDLETMPLWDAIQSYFAVGQPVWLIDRPGAFDHVYAYATIAELRAHLQPIGWLEESAVVGSCDAPVVAAPIPTVDCDGDTGMSQEGCMLATVSDEYHRVSTLMQAAVDYDFGDWSPAQIQSARDQEQWILKVFVSSEHGVTLAFRRHAGTWILVAIDLSRYSCSA